MKKYNLLAIVSMFLLGSIFLPQFLHAQKNKDSIQEKKVTGLLDNQHFRFIAQSATPASGRTRQLESQYDLQVSKERVVADLPYFGTAYFSPVNPSEGGVKFTSKDFVYNVAKRKKDGWDVFIKGKDFADPPNMALTVFSDGKATLQVTSNSRQGISYNGYIVDPDNEK
jgi:Domain of unknown function (DUF4251)